MDYKTRKVQFIQDLQGSDLNTVSQLIILTVVCHGLWFLARSLAAKLGLPQPKGDKATWLDFSLDFILICFPLLAFLTGFSAQVERVNALGSVLVLVGSTLLRINAKGPRLGKRSPSPKAGFDPRSKRIPYISIYRSSLMIMTCIAILAVDFNVFPRFYAKVETFGSSLMDLGVGTFVFSSGLVSGRAPPPTQYSEVKEDILASIRKSIPLCVVGLLRLLSVKLTNYQEHITEYGVHWNFFLTLACLPLPVAIIEGFTAGVGVSGWSLALIYQIILSRTPLQEYILSPTRVMGHLFSMNREGLCSLWGYVAIFLIGKELGRAMFYSDPQRPLPIEFGKRFLLYLGLFSVSHYFVKVPISRRLANFSYISWVSCLNVAQLAGFYVMNKLLGIKEISVIHQAINFNGLLVFLVANILTGVVNLTVPTLDVSDNQAYGILAGYLFVLCLLAYILLLFRRKLI